MIVNFEKMVSVLVACVAATIVVSACGGPTNTGAPVPSVSADVLTGPKPPLPNEAGAQLDYLKHWSSDERNSDMEAVGNQVGLSNLTLPTAENMDMGFIGIAELEARCFVAFTVAGTSADSNTLSVIVMSRYNDAFNELGMNLSVPNGVRDFINNYRDLCRL